MRPLPTFLMTAAVAAAAATSLSGQQAPAPAPAPAPVAAAAAPAPTTATDGLTLVPYVFRPTLSATLGGNSISESGFGGGITIGWGFSGAWQVVGDVAFASMRSTNDEPYRLRESLVAARYHFTGAASALRPYVEGGYGVRDVSRTSAGSTQVVSGGGFALGGGIRWAFSASAALDAGLRWVRGAMTRGSLNGMSYPIDTNNTTTSTTFRVGLAWHP